jgi:hypothetical protein
VQAFVDTRRSFDAIVRASRSGRKGRKNDVRRARGFEPRVGRGAAEVRRFLNEWYLPFASARWGAGFASLGRDFMRQAERFCEVLWILRDGERVAGVLLEPQGRTLRSLALGVRDERERPHAFSAVQVFTLEHAVASGYTRLRLGGSRPVLSDPPLRFKLKWGGTLDHVLQWDYLALRIDGARAATRSLLAAHPIVAEIDGRFFVVTRADSAGHVSRPEWGIAGVATPCDSGFDVRPYAS